MEVEREAKRGNRKGRVDGARIGGSTDRREHGEGGTEGSGV